MTTKVDHNYPTPDALLVVDTDTGLPIEYVSIRVYSADAYPPPTGSDTWTAATITDAEGKWIDPVYLPDGEDWVVHFDLNLTYAAKTVEIST